MTTVPLIGHASATAVVAYRGGDPILARQFLADVVQLTHWLPEGSHVLNACADRYRFAVGFAASLVTQKISLLPSTHTPEVIGFLRTFSPKVFCLTDAAMCNVDLPQIRFPVVPAPQGGAWRIPDIPAAQVAACVFTSGSTGTPVPHRKTWGRLHRSVRIEAERLGLNSNGSWAILATVPQQHMYGFETSLLLPMVTAQAFCAERPFYPADIVARISALPRPRALVSTPVHLRTLLSTGIKLPLVDLVVAATAPLDAELARQVEFAFSAPLVEIYGATETGQIASRRTVQTSQWALWPGVELAARDGATWATGGHIEQPTAMADILELTEPGFFLLHGRSADLVNVAGKRSSLAYLNHQLNAIPGVVDGAFFLRDGPGETSPTGVTRLGAVAVAPALSVAVIRGQLRRSLDPVFLPRPLLLVDEMPRNATGKLPLAVLKTLTTRR